MVDETQAKVDRAIEELEAEGVTVTARAVRERAGVRMSVAAEAARAWNEQHAAQVDVPEVPDAVQVRMDALWREAVQMARAELAAEREGLRQQVEDAHQEAEEWRAEVKALEDTRDDLTTGLKETREQAALEAKAASQQAEELRRRADRAEAKLEVLEAERDRLLSERDNLQQQHDRLLERGTDTPAPETPATE